MFLVLLLTLLTLLLTLLTLLLTLLTLLLTLLPLLLTLLTLLLTLLTLLLTLLTLLLTLLTLLTLLLMLLTLLLILLPLLLTLLTMLLLMLLAVLYLHTSPCPTPSNCRQPAIMYCGELPSAPYKLMVHPHAPQSLGMNLGGLQKRCHAHALPLIYCEEHRGYEEHFLHLCLLNIG